MGLERAEQRLRALKLKVLALARVGDDICEPGGHRDTADLVAQRTGADRARWASEQRLAEALERRWRATGRAWVQGRISGEHARVIVRVLDDLEALPAQCAEQVDAATLSRSEEYLIGLAGQYSPARLRRLATHLFEVVAPQAADEIEAKRLAAMERRAERAMGVVIRRNAGGVAGLSEIRARVPDPIADRFTTYLGAFTNPRVTTTDLGVESAAADTNPDANSTAPDTNSTAAANNPDTGDNAADNSADSAGTGGEGPISSGSDLGECGADGSPLGEVDRGVGRVRPVVPFTSPDGLKIPHSRRLAMAFAQLLETLDPRRLPIHGGDATTVVVTIGLDQIRAELAAAGHGLGDDSSRISAAQARRLACTANLIPAVLNGKSEILDLGRSRRLFTRAQRRAMAIRDGRCRAEGCTIPAAWCEAHHRRPWASGGRTDLDDGLLLCRWHHHRAHDDRYLHQVMPGGDIRYTRRT